MARPKIADAPVVDAWLRTHPGWARDGAALVRTYRLPDFGAALALAVRIGMISEKRDHHPELTIGWGTAKVLWTTHDAGGITELDLALAEASDACLAPSAP